VKGRSPGYHEQSRITATFVEIKTREAQEKAEYESMSYKIPICDRRGKYYPADGLIYDIGQDGSEGHIPVIDPTANTWHKIPEDVKQGKCDPEVSEKEHGKSTCFLTSKMLSMMRRDIDRKPGNALFTARIGAEAGIRATYYFSRYGSAYRPEIMREIEGMGHEVGYHYEVLGKAKSD